MPYPRMNFRSVLSLLLLTGMACVVQAHDYSAGDIHIGHPFAVPTPPGLRNGAAYVATLANRGDRGDRLLRATTTMASRVEIHTMEIDAAGVMRMREAGDLPLAPGVALEMRPGQGVHLMLLGLKQPLAKGDTFMMTLEFEHAGAVEVKVVVQQPREAAAEHKH